MVEAECFIHISANLHASIDYKIMQLNSIFKSIKPTNTCIKHVFYFIIFPFFL
jgi:hypothetical protein